MLRSKNVSSGFSLLELLVVMAVMGIMIGLVGFSFIGSGGGQIGQGQRLLLSLLQQVKTLAVSSGKEARLIVSADSTDEEKYLRYMEIVLEGNDDDDPSESWVVQGSGIYLPNQVWFVSDELENMPDEWPSDGHCLWSNPGDAPFKLSYPVAGKRFVEGQDMKLFHYISCNVWGVFETSTSLKLVLSSGNLRQVDGDLKPYFPNPKILLGVLVQPFGGMFALGSEDFLHGN
jgi:prepilin-type N-terminal cleavage/methylation domain-containing protein